MRQNKEGLTRKRFIPCFLEASDDDVVSGLCTHTYHRQCIMDWLKHDHDECPNCRQSMWDKVEYDRIDASIMNQQQPKQKCETLQEEESEFIV